MTTVIFGCIVCSALLPFLFYKFCTFPFLISLHDILPSPADLVCPVYSSISLSYLLILIFSFSVIATCVSTLASMLFTLYSL